MLLDLSKIIYLEFFKIKIEKTNRNKPYFFFKVLELFKKTNGYWKKNRRDTLKA